MGRGRYAFFITPARPYPIVTVVAPPPWPRILTPAEVAALRSVIDLPRLRILFDVILYTGMRYADLRQVLAEPDRFDEERGTITILTRGKKQRTVVLGDRGREAVTEFVGHGAQMPVRTTGWRVHLVRWSKMAGLSLHPNPPPGASLGNPSGIGVTSMRMTWESWLYALHPEWLRPIMASQGRDETGDITRYGALSWSADDLDAMRLKTAGWEPLDLRDRSHVAAARRPLPSPPDATRDVLRLHADGATVREIAAGTGLSSSEVRACLNRAGIATAPGFYARGRAREIFDKRGADLIAAYEAGASMHSLAAGAGVSTATLRLFLIAEGVSLRPSTSGGKPKDLDACKAELIAAYEAGTSIITLADRTGISHPRIRELLKAEGVALRDDRGRNRKRWPDEA